MTRGTSESVKQSRRRYRLECILSRTWLQSNLPEMFQRIQKRALKRYPGVTVPQRGRRNSAD